MIISGGLNILPAEIENFPLQPSIRIRGLRCAGFHIPNQGETPKAGVVLKREATATESEPIDWCADRVG